MLSQKQGKKRGIYNRNSGEKSRIRDLIFIIDSIRIISMLIVDFRAKMIISCIRFVVALTFSFHAFSANFDPTKAYFLDTDTTGRFLLAHHSVNKVITGYSNPDLHSALWSITEIDENTYALQSKYTQLYLGASSSGHIVFSTYRSSSHDWILTPQQDGFYTLKNAALPHLLLTSNDVELLTTDKGIDPEYHSKDNATGTVLLTETTTGVQSHLWRVSEAAVEPENTLISPTLGWHPEQSKKVFLTTDRKISLPHYELFTESGALFSGTMTYKGEQWHQHYYEANISDVKEIGAHTFHAYGLETTLTITSEPFQQLPSGEGHLRYEDMLRGFWDYQRIQSQPLPEATYRHGELVLTGKEYHLSGFGYYDAHSRDAKVGRFSNALSEMALAALAERNLEDKAALQAEIAFAVQHLLDVQHADGGFPLGKVRQDHEYYAWVTDTPTGTTSKATRALALASQALSCVNHSLSLKAKSAAIKGYRFIIAHDTQEDYAINEYDFSYVGGTIDTLGAFVELAILTDQQHYFVAADKLVKSGYFNKGVWRKMEGRFPAEYASDIQGMQGGSAVILSRYYRVARDTNIKIMLESHLTDFVNYWKNKSVTPLETPDFLSSFGQMQRYANLAKNMVHIYEATGNPLALTMALDNFAFVVGYNPFQLSSIEGINSKTTMPMMKRNFHHGVGALTPGIIKDKDQRITTDIFAYQSTEATIISSGQVFDIISRLRNVSYTNETNTPSMTQNQSLIHNGGFEYGLSHWVDKNISKIAITSRDTFSGSYAISVSERSAYYDSPRSAIANNLQALGEGKYLFSAMVKNEMGESEIKPMITLKQNGQSKTLQGKAYRVGTEWIKIDHVFDLSFSGDISGSELYIRNSDIAQNYMIDEVMFIKQGELIRNGGFESGSIEWFNAGVDTELVRTHTNSGHFALKLFNMNARYQSIKQDIKAALTANGAGIYHVSAFIKNKAHTNTAQIKIVLKSDDGFKKTVEIRPQTVTTEWHQLDQAITLQWTGNLTTAEIYFVNDSLDEYYLDDVSIRFVSTVQ